MQSLTCNAAGIFVLNSNTDSHFCPGYAEQSQKWFWNNLKIKYPHKSNPEKLSCYAVVLVTQLQTNTYHNSHPYSGKQI